MNFNLANSNGKASQRLQAWTINTVKYDGIELKKGNTQDGRAWQAIQFKFKGENGSFDTMVFCPGDKGDVRPTGSTNGREWEMPSQMETLQHTLAHVLTVLNPEGLKKLAGVELDLPKDFEKLFNYVKKVLDPKVGTETQIKLIGNNKGYASIPNFVNINKDSKESYISNNWLGENLAFSAYELDRKKKAEKATPSKVEATTTAADNSSSSDLDDDFDI